MSAGVLAVLVVLGVAGAYLVGAGGGAAGSASVRSAGSLATDEWRAVTLAPSTLGAEGDPADGAAPAAAPAAAPGASPGNLSTSEDDVAGRVDDGTVAPARPGVAAAGPSVVGVPEADRRAGIATSTLVEAGTGSLLVVPGSVPAPSAAPRMTVRVEVEEGIGADGPAFANFVMETLNDPRGWGHGGTRTFARTDGRADIRVILASPRTSARLCAPAQTRGTLSCGGGGKAVITMYRWMNGTPDYGADLTGYRHYVVNHEVGHVLGHGHAYCDPGHLAPVMLQQTKGLHGCLPNAWPFPR